MIVSETPLAGAYLIEPERLQDERGFFARSFCRDEFRRLGLVEEFVQNNISFNRKKATLRGLHFQVHPFSECKVVRCTMGKIFDAIVDLRPRSRTRGDWFGLELSAANRLALYIPAGFAHGFVTLTDDCEVFYLMSEFFHPECARSLLWNDPDVAIDWPLEPVLLSDKDASAAVLEHALSYWRCLSPDESRAC